MKDQRFKIAHREALIGIGLVLVNFAIWFGFAYGLGAGDPQIIRMFWVFLLGFSIAVSQGQAL